MQSSCRLGLKLSEGLTGLEDGLPSSWSWLLAGGLSSSPGGTLQRAAQDKAAGFPQRVGSERGRSGWKRQCLL